METFLLYIVLAGHDIRERLFAPPSAGTPLISVDAGVLSSLCAKVARPDAQTPIPRT